MLKVLATNPDAVFIGAAGTPGVIPQAALVERGFKGKIYQTHGIANDEFLKLGGKAVEGTFVPLAPMLVAEDLPPNHPAKKPSMEFISKFEAIPGAGAGDALCRRNPFDPSPDREDHPGAGVSERRESTEPFARR